MLKSLSLCNKVLSYLSLYCMKFSSVCNVCWHYAHPMSVSVCVCVCRFIEQIDSHNPLQFIPRKGSTSSQGSRRTISFEDSNPNSPVLVIRSRTQARVVQDSLEKNQRANDDLFELWCSACSRYCVSALSGQTAASAALPLQEAVERRFTLWLLFEVGVISAEEQWVFWDSLVMDFSDMCEQKRLLCFSFHPFFFFFFFFLPFLIWYMTWWSGLLRPLSGLCQPKLFYPKFQHWGRLRGWAKLSGGTCCLASGVQPAFESLQHWSVSILRRQQPQAAASSHILRRQWVPTSSGGNEFQHPQAATSSSCPWLLVSVLLVPHPPTPTASTSHPTIDGQFSRARIIRGHCSEPSPIPMAHLTPQYCGTLLPSRSTKVVVYQAHNICVETKPKILSSENQGTKPGCPVKIRGRNPAVQWKSGDKTRLSSENQGTKPCCPVKMRGQNPAVQWKWGTFPAHLREEGPVFRTSDVQRCKDRVQEKTAVFGVVANICSQAFASSLSVETVFPNQARWVWTGNNSVPKPSKRSLNREQQCSQTKQEEFE